MVGAIGSESALILAEAGAVFVLLGVISFFAARLQFSAVPLFLITGLAFGEGGISDLSSAGDYLDTTANIGALLLLLLLGLEYSTREITSSISDHWRAGLLDLVLSSLPGAVIAWWLGWGPIGMLALAGATYVSSSGIASQLLRDSGFQRSEIARRTVGVLVLEDLSLAPYLPLLSGLILGVGWWRGFLGVSVALVITGLVLFAGWRTEGHKSKILNSPDPRALLLTVFGAALLAAGGSEMLGFSGAVAAFLVGLALTGEVAAVVRARLSPLRDLAASVFFLFFGLTTDPRDLGEMLPAAAVLAVLGVAAKFVVAWRVGSDLTDRLGWRRIGAFLSPRGEFSLLIAGLTAEVAFGEKFLALTITYVILTATLGSIAVFIFRSRFSERGKPA